MSIIISQQHSFMQPYLREASKGHADEAEQTPVLLSSTDIYIPTHDRITDENGELDTSSPWFGLEQEFIRTHQGEAHVILRAAPVVGTGMQGFVRRLAEDIHRGTFLHFPGNECRISVVHAVDVAASLVALSSLRFASGSTNVYNISDGADPTLHDLAEALAYRMDNKRISTLSTKPQQWLGRVIYGQSKYAMYTTDRRYSSRRLRETIAQEPINVCEYLHTHIYDECSL